MRRVIAVGILTLLFHSATSAQGLGTTQDLYDRCMRDEVLCGSYLMRVASVVSLLGKPYKDPELNPELNRGFLAPFAIFAVCSTGAPVNGHILRHVFIACVDRHPEAKNEGMGASAVDAFKEAWPC
jgi:hypothetical protein